MGIKSRTLLASYAVLITLALFFAVYANMQNSAPLAVTTTEVDSRLLEMNIRQVAELATLVYHYTDVGVFEEQTTISIFGRSFSLPGTSKNFIIMYDGDMRLGIDISQIAIRVSDFDIFISLPTAEVLSHTIHEGSVQVLDENAGIFNRWSVSDYPNFIDRQKQEKEYSLIAGGLLEEASANAQEAILRLLSSMPELTDDYRFIFE